MGFLFASAILFLIGLPQDSGAVLGGPWARHSRSLWAAQSSQLLCSAVGSSRSTQAGAPVSSLPSPWSSVLPALAVGLEIALPTSLGGFIGLSVSDFMPRRKSRWIRLVGYAIVFGARVATAPWIFGITFDCEQPGTAAAPDSGDSAIALIRNAAGRRRG